VVEGRYWWICGLATALGCAIGTKDDGFGSAASIGEGDETETGSVGGNDGMGATSAGDGAMSVGGNDGGDESGDGPMPPSNPNEMCNGIDDDNNGLIDDGLGELGCGIGECATVVPACIGGAVNVCEPGAAATEACNGLDDDCDGTPDNGVAAVDCSTACGGGSQSCSNGSLTACDAPQPSAESCNTIDDDCNGQYDEGVGGCRIPVHRSYNPSTGEHFYTTSLPEAQTPGFNLEFQNFYYLYANQQPGTVAFYRCWIPAIGMHLYTTSPTCEGQTVEGTMGYIGTSDIAGGTPLYRAAHTGNGDHFYTNSLTEYNNAVAGAYVAEGSVGFVW
jgi:hypothetical protein